MTINFEQVNNTPFSVGSILGSYGVGVSVSEVEELCKLLSGTESQDIDSQLLPTVVMGALGAAPEIFNSVKYRDDVRAAYKLATEDNSVLKGNNIFEKYSHSNGIENLLINDTKEQNKLDGKDFWSKVCNWFKKDSSKANAAESSSTTTTSKTTMNTNGGFHQAFGIKKEDKILTIKNMKQNDWQETGLNKVRNKILENISNNASTNFQEIIQENTTEAITNYDLKSIENKDIKKAVKNGISKFNTMATSAKNATKSVAKEAFGGWGIILTTGMGLLAEIPNLTTAFNESSSEGWKQLGKSLATIAISDITLSGVGQLLCGTLGFAIGGLIGPVGASIGGAIGKSLGSAAFSWVGRKLSSWIFGKSSTEKQQENLIKEQAQVIASSQTDLTALLAQAKAQAEQETDATKAQQILAKVQVIENKINPTLPSTNTYTNPFVTAQ